MTSDGAVAVLRTLTAQHFKRKLCEGSSLGPSCVLCLNQRACWRLLPESSGGGPTLAPALRPRPYGLLSEAPQNAERGDRVWKGLSSTTSARACGCCRRRKCVMNSTCALKPEVDPRT